MTNGSAVGRLGVLALLAVIGCKRSDDDAGAAPPPAASVKPGACASGGGTPGDPPTASLFARTIGDYCVDPNGDTRAYGEGAKGTLDDVCIEQLDGECEVYKRYGLRRTVTLRYVDGKGSPGVVAVLLSQFKTGEGAFGFFTKRVVADGDPAKTTLSPLEAGAAAALGSGIAYVVRGEHLLELSYTNESEPPDRMRESGKRILPEIARSIGDRLPGKVAQLPAVQCLPFDKRVPLGITYAMSDVLGVTGLGSGAVGYYRDGARRYRMACLAGVDADAAEDLAASLKKATKASSFKHVVNDGTGAIEISGLSFSLHHEDSPRTEWVARRQGRSVVAVGDEELVLGTDAPKDATNATKLTNEEKITLLGKLAGVP